MKTNKNWQEKFPLHPNKLIFLAILTLACFGLKAQNIMISNSGNPNEPSIAIDPKKPSTMIAGANNNKYYVSLDTGRTWRANTLVSSYGVWGDPTITVDTAGNFYFFHLSNPPSGSWIDRIVCQKTSTKGKIWTDGSYAGLNGKKAQDKQWCAIDRANNNLYLTWSQFDSYGSTNAKDSSLILFSKSTDAGVSWSSPIRISKQAGDCVDEDNTVEGAVPAVGPKGEVYVSWAGPNGLVFNKSTDQGNTWLLKETPIDPMPGGWDFGIPGISRANGLPITACDTSKGPNRGTIYVNWSDQRNGDTDTDIWLAKSTDGGNTWSAPKKVNDDNTKKHQFFTWMTIDQTNGYLYFVFYDRRHHNDESTDVYAAVSVDGGNTFINKKISETPFIPKSSIFFGDYTNITAHNGIIRPIWTRLHNGQLSIWTDLTKHRDFEIATGTETEETSSDLSFENYPNPTHDYQFVSFKLRSLSTINLYVYGPKGELVAKIIDGEKRGYGKYVERIDFTTLNLPSGMYMLLLQIDGQTKVNRSIKH